jgi:hypothetical protein
MTALGCCRLTQHSFGDVRPSSAASAGIVSPIVIYIGYLWMLGP